MFIKEKLKSFDTFSDNDRELLINMTTERFRRKLEKFNNAEGNSIHIDGFVCGYGNLELNKNAYYMLQLTYKEAKARGNASQIKCIENIIIDSEAATWLSFKETYILKAIQKIGGIEEVKARIAVDGACHLTLDEDIASQWVNTHTMNYLIGSL